MQQNTKSILYALVAVLSWSTVATAFKITLQYLTHFEMVLVASATAMVVFAIALTIQGKWHLVRHLEARRWGYYALLGLLNPVAYYLVLFKSYDLLPAQVAQPINYTWPIVLLIMLALFSGQKIYRGKYIGMFLSFLGVAMISLGISPAPSQGGENEGRMLGLVLGFFSAFLWATYWMVNNRNKQQSSQDGSSEGTSEGAMPLFLSFFFGTLYLSIAALFTGVDYSSATGILAGMYVGCFEMGIPFIFFAMALRTTSNPALVNQISYLSPFLSLFLIAIFLGETIAITTVIGLALIVTGIVLNEFMFTGEEKTITLT